MGPDINKIKRKIKTLKIPREYWGIDIDEFFSHQWNIYLSIRETAGKTTQSLIFGLVLNSLYPDHYTIEYLRNDQSQTTKANIETIFDTKRFIPANITRSFILPERKSFFFV